MPGWAARTSPGEDRRGAKPTPAYDLADWVLGRFPKEQEPALKTALEHATAAVRLLVEGKTDEAMNLYNR